MKLKTLPFSRGNLSAKNNKVDYNCTKIKCFRTIILRGKALWQQYLGLNLGLVSTLSTAEPHV